MHWVVIFIIFVFPRVVIVGDVNLDVWIGVKVVRKMSGLAVQSLLTDSCSFEMKSAWHTYCLQGRSQMKVNQAHRIWSNGLHLHLRLVIELAGRLSSPAFSSSSALSYNRLHTCAIQSSLLESIIINVRKCTIGQVTFFFFFFLFLFLLFLPYFLFFFLFLIIHFSFFFLFLFFFFFFFFFVIFFSSLSSSFYFFFIFILLFFFFLYSNLSCCGENRKHNRNPLYNMVAEYEHLDLCGV